MFRRAKTVKLLALKTKIKTNRPGWARISHKIVTCKGGDFIIQYIVIMFKKRITNKLEKYVRAYFAAPQTLN